MDSAQNTAIPPLPEHFAPMADRYFVVSDGNLYELDPTEDSQAILSVHLEPTLYAIECGKAQPLSSTHEVGTQEAGTQAEVVAFALHPAAVFSLKKVTKKGALKLLPWGIVSKAKKKPEHNTYIEYCGLFWNIAPFKACSNFAQAEGVLSPFWWCKGTTESEFANMEFVHLKKNGIKIPYLQNCKPLAKHEQLMFLDMKALEVAEANNKRKLGHH